MILAANMCQARLQAVVTTAAQPQPTSTVHFFSFLSDCLQASPSYIASIMIALQTPVTLASTRPEPVSICQHVSYMLHIMHHAAPVALHDH